MKTQSNQNKIAVIGAGMAGPLISILLARRGYAVTLFERRSLDEHELIESGRSFNLTLTKRGLAALQAVGLENDVKIISSPLLSRTTHRLNGGATQTKYGKLRDDILYSIKRTELNQLLVRAARATENIILRDRFEYVDFNVSSAQLT